MKIINVAQGSNEWLSTRLGVLTASRFDELVTTKGEPSKQADKYILKIAGEFVAGKMEETYQNDAMKRGVELEDQARQMYQFVTGNVVEQVGFCLSDCGGYGCSPDGLIGTDGGMEIKCPSIATHVKYLLDNKLPSDYFQQVQGSLFVTERKWWDFTSFYPGIKPLIVRCYPDVEFHKALKVELDKSVVRLKEIITKIK